MSSSAPKPEKGVPIPPPRSSRRKYGFHDLQPGESVLIKTEDRRLVRDAFTHHARRVGWHYASRLEETGVRVWRRS